jgi:opacity protein-like surface antigen
MTRILTAVLLACFVSAPAIAGPAGSTYAGVQYAWATYEEDGLEDFNPTAVVGRFGHYFNDHFSLEGRVGVGASEDSVSYGSLTADVEIDNFFGIYGVGHLPLTDAVSVYALAGLTKGEATATVRGPGGSISASDDDSGFSYGIGGEVALTRNASVTVEYTSYLDKSDYQLSALSAGLNFRF